PTLSERQQENFVNRQLVETRQITKHLTNILTQKYNGEVNVVGIKAQLNDLVKKSLGIIKVREINHHHHAVDAYMVGFIYNFLANNNKESYVDGKIKWKQYRQKYTSHPRNDTYWLVNEIVDGKIIDKN